MRKVLKIRKCVSNPKKLSRQQQDIRHSRYYVTIGSQRQARMLNKTPSRRRYEVVTINGTQKKRFSLTPQEYITLKRREKTVRQRTRTVDLTHSGITVLCWVSAVAILALAVDGMCHLEGLFLTTVFVLVCIPVLAITALWIRNQIR